MYRRANKKAFKFGAPIEMFTDSLHDSINRITTAEQMIGWLIEQGVYSYVRPEPWCKNGKYYMLFTHIISILRCRYLDLNETNEDIFHSSYKEAILAAIDAALNYLSNK